MDTYFHGWMDGWVDHLSKVKLNGFSMLSIKSYEDYVSTFGKINEKKGYMSAGRESAGGPV